MTIRELIDSISRGASNVWEAFLDLDISPVFELLGTIIAVVLLGLAIFLVLRVVLNIVIKLFGIDNEQRMYRFGSWAGRVFRKTRQR